MKKISILLIIILIFSGFIASAETVKESASNDGKSANANVQVDLRGASVTNQGNSAPYSHPGTAGQIPQFYDDFKDEAALSAYIVDERLNGRTLEELLRIAGDINHPMEKPIIVTRMPENDDPVVLMGTQPKKTQFLGQTNSKYAKFTEANLVRISAMIMAEEKILSRCKYGALKITFFKEPNIFGLSFGSGSAKNIGNETGASVGALFGWAKAWNARYFEASFEAYASDGEQAGEAKKPAAQSPAQQVSAPLSQPICEPIYFEFDIDVPLPGQDAKLRKIYDWIVANYRIIQELEFRGYCDVRASEDYNSKLGFRRGKNVMLMIISAIDKNVGADQKQNFWALASRFRATSASDYKPTYSGTDEASHQKNRRVELILNGQNLTPIN